MNISLLDCAAMGITAALFGKWMHSAVAGFFMLGMFYLWARLGE